MNLLTMSTHMRLKPTTSLCRHCPLAVSLDCIQAQRLLSGIRRCTTIQRPHKTRHLSRKTHQLKPASHGGEPFQRRPRLLRGYLSCWMTIPGSIMMVVASGTATARHAALESRSAVAPAVAASSSTSSTPVTEWAL